MSSRPRNNAIQHRVPTLPTPTTLRAKSTQSVALDQSSAIWLEASCGTKRTRSSSQVRMSSRSTSSDQVAAEGTTTGGSPFDAMLAVDELRELREGLHAVLGAGPWQLSSRWLRSPGRSPANGTGQTHVRRRATTYHTSRLVLSRRSNAMASRIVCVGPRSVSEASFLAEFGGLARGVRRSEARARRFRSRSRVR